MSGTSMVTGGLVGASGISLVTSGLIDLELFGAGPGEGAAAPSQLRLGARIQGSTIFEVPDHLQWNLTPECLESVGLDPIIPGEYVSYRHQVVDVDGVAVSLDGADLVMSLYKLDSLAESDRVFRRRTLDTIANWDPATQQLEVDAQATEDTEAGTGTGWWTFTFAPTDEELLIASIGSWWYDVRARFADGKVRTILRGRIAISWPRTIVADFTP